MKLYNTLIRRLDKFKPIKKNKIGIYSCGPTVYWNQHIGHMYAYTQWDSLIKFFRYLGYKTKWVMNITDVGHMTSDEDIGEDKMEKGARREGISVWDIAKKYIDQFTESMQLLNIQKPDVLCRATEHIKEQIKLAQKIEANGFTYKTETGLVFDTTKFPAYANFAKLDLTKQEAGIRVEIDPEKKKPWDFLLWVTNQPKHIMQWSSPWGKGFPGWHLECTAMSTKYLGEQFDIHTGGMEHIPVHHTNEIAQAFGAFGRQTANYWIHNEWLTVKGQKMSKSTGNFYTVQDLRDKGYNPLSLRYLILTSHYRKGLDFTFESLDGAQTALNNLINNIKAWKKQSPSLSDNVKNKSWQNKFINALSNNLNWPQAMAIVWQLIKSNLPESEKLSLLLDWDKVLGLDLDKAASERNKEEIPPKIEDLKKKREQLRKQRKFDAADEIRKQVNAEGFVFQDTTSGTAIFKK